MSANQEQIMAWASLLEMLIADGVKAKANYDAARALANSSGVSDADLASADARFAKVFTDPLGSPVGDPPPPVPTPSAPYNVVQFGMVPPDDGLKMLGFKAGDKLATGTLDAGEAWEVSGIPAFFHSGLTYSRTIA